jgi:hypothetical protein
LSATVVFTLLFLLGSSAVAPVATVAEAADGLLKRAIHHAFSFVLGCYAAVIPTCCNATLLLQQIISLFFLLNLFSYCNSDPGTYLLVLKKHIVTNRHELCFAEGKHFLGTTRK